MISKFHHTAFLNTRTFSFPSCISYYTRNRILQLSTSNAPVLYKVLNKIIIRKNYCNNNRVCRNPQTSSLG